MRTTKRERFAEMRSIIERICDADLATRGSTDALQEQMAIATLTAIQTAVSVAIVVALVVSP